MGTLSRVMETVWLLLALACLGIGIYSTVKAGFQDSYMFYILATLALVMYWLRRFRRVKEVERTKANQ